MLKQKLEVLKARKRAFYYAKRHRAEHADPVEQGTFRLMVLDDNPFPTYIGRRAWCPPQPYWDDGSCRCTHTEEAPSA